MLERCSTSIKLYHDLQACFNKTTQEDSPIWSLNSCLCGPSGTAGGVWGWNRPGWPVPWSRCRWEAVGLTGTEQGPSSLLRKGMGSVISFEFLVKECGSPSGLRALFENRQLK